LIISFNPTKARDIRPKNQINQINEINQINQTNEINETDEINQTNQIVVEKSGENSLTYLSLILYKIKGFFPFLSNITSIFVTKGVELCPRK
jgi:hypothetical protein